LKPYWLHPPLTALEQVTDEYGTRHTAWRVADPQIITAVKEAMSNKRLVIADGHHRYETALAYRNYCRETGRRMATQNT